jgi:hypothetical protein
MTPNGMPWPAMLIVMIAVLCVIGLLAWARGPEHYRGDDLGTHGTKIIVVQPAN